MLTDLAKGIKLKPHCLQPDNYLICRISKRLGNWRSHKPLKMRLMTELKIRGSAENL
jgi:hypothetical protein